MHTALSEQASWITIPRTDFAENHSEKNHAMRTIHSSTSAFTMIEIMLVVMIIAILAGAAIGMMSPSVRAVETKRAQTDVTSIKTQVQLYEALCQSLPARLSDLVEKPANAQKWQQLMEQVPRDPWGTEYLLEVPNKRSKKSYDIYSCGPDRKPHTEDDIGNWE